MLMTFSLLVKNKNQSCRYGLCFMEKKSAKDADILELLTLMVGDITPEHDLKLQELLKIIDNKINHPINEGNKR